MASIEELLAEIRHNTTSVRFSTLTRICDHYFGSPRIAKGSHRIYRTPWSGNPRITIQNSRGSAKMYQVKQVLAAIERLESGDTDEK